MLKSCLIQCCLSYISAYEKYNFVHRDFHPANILLKPSKKTSITYEPFDTTIETFGMRSWIMDFENATFETRKTEQSNIDFCQDFNRFFIFIPTFMPQINYVGTQQIAINFTLLCEQMRTNYQLNIQDVLCWINDYISIK